MPITRFTMPVIEYLFAYFGDAGGQCLRAQIRRVNNGADGQQAIVLLAKVKRFGG